MADNQNESIWKNVGARAAIIAAFIGLLGTIATTAIGYVINKSNGAQTTTVQNFYTGFDKLTGQTPPPPKQPAIPVFPFKYDPPRIIRDQQGVLTVELPVTNIKPYPLTITASYDGNGIRCGEKIIDNRNMSYIATSENDCSMKSEHDTHNTADIIKKGQELRPGVKTTLIYTLRPMGSEVGDAIQLFKLGFTVVHRDETKTPYIQTREAIDFDPGIKIN